MSLQDIEYFVQNKWESSLFFINNIWHVMWPFLNAFILPAAWCVFVRKHWKVCCGLLQWSDRGTVTVVWCRTCTVRFFRRLSRIFFKFSTDLGVQNEGTVKSGIFTRWRFENCSFFILSRIQHEEFYYYKAICCKSYVQLLIQDVYSISSKTCQL